MVVLSRLLVCARAFPLRSPSHNFAAITQLHPPLPLRTLNTSHLIKLDILCLSKERLCASR